MATGDTIFEFGSFQLDPAKRLLLRQRVPQALTPKTFDVLLLLVEDRARVVNKDELMDRLWPNTFVGDGNLSQHISMLRKVLEGEAQSVEYIRTIPRRGYRFVAPVTERPTVAATSTPSEVPASGTLVDHAAHAEAERRQEQTQEHSMHRRAGSGGALGAAGVCVAVPAAAAVLLIGGWAYALFVRSELPGPVVTLKNPVQVTSEVGVEEYPTWSPDGRTLAYQASTNGNWDVWIKQVTGGPAVNRTKDFTGSDRHPAWSPDGRSIAFYSARDGGAILVMPALAGPARRVGSAIAYFGGPPQWSHDSTALAYVVRTVHTGQPAQIDIVPLHGGETRHIAMSLDSGYKAAFDLAWSPRNTFFAYVQAKGSLALVTRLWVLRLSDRHAIPVTDGHSNDWRPIWSDDERTLYFMSNRGGSTDLWQQRLAEDGTPMGPCERVTNGMSVRNAALSNDQKKLAYSQGRQIANLWRVPLLAGRAATWADATQLTFDQAYLERLDVSPDRELLLIGSDRSGNHDVWTMPVDGGEMRQLTTDPAPDFVSVGAWSPDGHHVGFYSYRNGSRDVWMMPLDGGPARQLTDGPSQEFGPAWSPDGQHFVFSSDRTGILSLWVGTRVSGEPKPLTRFDGGAGASWSPDGRWVAFNRLTEGVQRLWRVPATGGDPELLGTAKIGSEDFVWSRDGQSIYSIGPANIWALSLQDRAERAVTNLEGRRGHLGVGLGTDDRYLYFTWHEDLGDLWVMDVVK